jgi:hypothetical protein
LSPPSPGTGNHGTADLLPASSVSTTGARMGFTTAPNVCQRPRLGR